MVSIRACRAAPEGVWWRGLTSGRAGWPRGVESHRAEQIAERAQQRRSEPVGRGRRARTQLRLGVIRRIHAEMRRDRRRAIGEEIDKVAHLHADLRHLRSSLRAAHDARASVHVCGVPAEERGADCDTQLDATCSDAPKRPSVEATIKGLRHTYLSARRLARRAAHRGCRAEQLNRRRVGGGAQPGAGGAACGFGDEVGADVLHVSELENERVGAVDVIETARAQRLVGR